MWQKEVQGDKIRIRTQKYSLVFHCPFLFPHFELKTESSQLILAQALIKTRACLLFPPLFTAIPHSVYQQHQLACLLSHAEAFVHVRSVCVWMSVITDMAMRLKRELRKHTLCW